MSREYNCLGAWIGKRPNVLDWAKTEIQQYEVIFGMIMTRQMQKTLKNQIDMLKRIYFGYIHGLYKLIEKGNDPEIYVLLFLTMCFFLYIISFGYFFRFEIPLNIFHINKWINRLTGGLILVGITKYIFQVKYNTYIKYEPMSKKMTLTLTIIYVGFFFIILVLKDYFPRVKS